LVISIEANNQKKKKKEKKKKRKKPSVIDFPPACERFFLVSNSLCKSTIRFFKIIWFIRFFFSKKKKYIY